MAVLNAGFERGTNGATIALADVGDGDAWDANAQLGASAAAIYDTTHAALGAQAAKISTAGTSTTAYLTWISKLGTVTDHYGRVYLYFTALPGATVRLIDIRTSSQTACFVNVLLTTGLLTVNDQGSTLRGTSVNAIATNQWVRLEYHAVHSTTVGSLEIKLFNTATSGTATETVTASTINTLASADRIRFGVGANAANIGPFWLDQIQAGATGYPGVAPVGLPSRTLMGVG